MAVILDTPNSEDQVSSTVTMTGPATFQVSGTFAGSEEIIAECRKTSGSVTDWYPIAELSLINGPGPVNITLYGMDLRFRLNDFVSGTTEVKIED